ncbi:MAG: hypothetical protein VX944_09105 [Myxococcota bacterium]|nr:hypothetical protein [Myxococcota bacterium]MEC9390219.1 hypothetical protein [Myxococcota bacterium]
MTWWTMLLALMMACTAQPPPDPTVTGRARTTLVEGDAIERVDVLNAEGLVLETQRLDSPTTRMHIGAGWSDGARSVAVHRATGTVTLAIPPPSIAGPLEVRIDAPVGQGTADVADGSVHRLSLVGGAQAQVAIAAEVIEPGTYRIALGDSQRTFADARAGARLTLLATIGGSETLTISGPSEDRVMTARVEVNRTTTEALRDQLALVDAPFPVDARGNTEIDRPANRVTLPAGWWKTVLKRTALGTRNWDRYSPWGHQGVTLQNPTETPINVAIRTVVTRTDGTPDPIFRPRFRDVGDATNDTTALLRIPAQATARAVLPVYVDDTLLDGVDAPPDGWLRRIEVTPLGVDTPILVADEPLYVSKASSVISGLLFVALTGALTGLALIGTRWRSWLNERPTTSLMVIAMLGAMMFTVGAGGQLIGMSIAAVLGPFSSLLTGLINDAFRTALMMTLLTLQPRTGTAALAILVDALLGALTLGQFGPSQLLIIGNSVLWTELFLWLTGVTRTTEWIRGPGFWMWARVAAALALANLTTGAFGLVLAAVLYRFYYAEWYVAMILIGPSFGYVLLGCAIALPFARSLREVSP